MANHRAGARGQTDAVAALTQIHGSARSRLRAVRSPLDDTRPERGARAFVSEHRSLDDNENTAGTRFHRGANPASRIPLCQARSAASADAFLARRPVPPQDTVRVFRATMVDAQWTSPPDQTRRLGLGRSLSRLSDSHRAPRPFEPHITGPSGAEQATPRSGASSAGDGEDGGPPRMPRDGPCRFEGARCLASAGCRP
jgi:hypothetical protein